MELKFKAMNAKVGLWSLGRRHPLQQNALHPLQQNALGTGANTRSWPMSWRYLKTGEKSALVGLYAKAGNYFLWEPWERWFMRTQGLGGCEWEYTYFIPSLDLNQKTRKNLSDLDFRITKTKFCRLPGLSQCLRNSGCPLSPPVNLTHPNAATRVQRQHWAKRLPGNFSSSFCKWSLWADQTVEKKGGEKMTGKEHSSQKLNWKEIHEILDQERHPCNRNSKSDTLRILALGKNHLN